MQFAKAMGYKCVAVDTRDPPLQLVPSLPEKFASDLILNPTKDRPEDALEKIANAFPGATGVEAAIVSTDAILAFKNSTGLIQKHGTLAVVGQPKEDIPFHYSVFVSGDLTIVPRRLEQPVVVGEMLNVVQTVGIHVEGKVYGLTEIDQLMKDYRDPGMKGKLVIKID